MTDKEKQLRAVFALHANKMLESRRDAFTIGPQTFVGAVWREPENNHRNLYFGADDAGQPGRVVTAAAIRFILDWAQNDWDMSLGDFLSGMYFGRPWDQTTPPWKLIPEAQDRMTADSLGFGHLYPTKDAP